MLSNISTSTLQKLQRVQNNLARGVCGVSKSQRPSEDLLHELHWLPIRQGIHYKIATITCRALHLQQPSYISSLLVNYIPPRTLRVTSQGLLPTHLVHELLLAPDFLSAAPVIWNKLPYTVRSTETIGTFLYQTDVTSISRHDVIDICCPATDSLFFVKLAINIRLDSLTNFTIPHEILNYYRTKNVMSNCNRSTFQ